MRKFPLVSLAVLALAGCAAADSQTAATPIPTATPVAYNPQIPQGTGIFAEASTLPFHAPDFTRIKDSDYQPSIEQGIAIQLAEVAAIANNPDAPTFDNTIVGLEKSGQMLGRTYSVFSALTGANTNDTLDAIDTATAPKLAAMRDAITLDPKLFARVKTLYDNRASLNLDPDQLQVLTLQYQSMVHNGANLNDADKATLTAINGELSKLSTDFSQRLTKGTKDGALVVTDKAKLAGLSDADIAAAAKNAADRGLPKGSYVLALQNTTQQPLLASLTDRATRQALFEHSWNRSERGDANDTRALVQRVAQLRAQKAKLLGFPDYASFTLYDQMAKTPTNAIGLISQMLPAIGNAQRRDAADLTKLIKAQGGKFAVTPADWDFYAGKLKKQRYNIDESEVKPYLEIHNVLENGVFYAANQLYGLTFKKRTDIPVYQEDVTVYTVYDADGSELALFYFDPWKRDNKSGGAWMSTFVDQSGLMGTKPVVLRREFHQARRRSACADQLGRCQHHVPRVWPRAPRHVLGPALSFDRGDQHRARLCGIPQPVQ